MRIKLEEWAIHPTRANPTDAGLDLHNPHTFMLQPGEVKFVDTGVSVDLTSHNLIRYVGLVFQRSSMVKIGVTLANSVGVIDASYRGNLVVALRSHRSEESVKFLRGDKIAQLVLVPILIPELQIYSGSKEDWLNTDRSDGGFGSTGR